MITALSSGITKWTVVQKVAKKKNEKKQSVTDCKKKKKNPVHCPVVLHFSSQGSPSHSAGPTDVALILTQWPTAFGTLVPPFGPYHNVHVG